MARYLWAVTNMSRNQGKGRRKKDQTIGIWGKGETKLSVFWKKFIY